MFYVYLPCDGVAVVRWSRINHCLLLLNVGEVAISGHIFLLSIILLFCFLN